MNVTSLDEARALLAKLPLDQAKLMEFDLIELGPLSPLHLLLIEGWATDRAPPRMGAEKIAAF